MLSRWLKFMRCMILLFTISVLSGCGYKSYEECFLDKMHGQEETMKKTAEKLCERKFPYEKKI